MLNSRQFERGTQKEEFHIGQGLRLESLVSPMELGLEEGD